MSTWADDDWDFGTSSTAPAPSTSEPQQQQKQPQPIPHPAQPATSTLPQTQATKIPIIGASFGGFSNPSTTVASSNTTTRAPSPAPSTPAQLVNTNPTPTALHTTAAKVNPTPVSMSALPKHNSANPSPAFASLAGLNLQAASPLTQTTPLNIAKPSVLPGQPLSSSSQFSGLKPASGLSFGPQPSPLAGLTAAKSANDIWGAAKAIKPPQNGKSGHNE
eukprot:c41130_g1_i1.p1 GENE.c41130_g1_i1~~c41130_g1_i1.p1  ORF type:complete len:257 (+),score=28.76 c41130_g1_i1:116-772(+)